MISIILASHGAYAEGIFQSGKMIFGEQENVETDILKPDENPNDLRRKFEDSLKKFGDKSNVLFLVDIWGGTPFNIASQIVYKNSSRMSLVTGLNLPMLIETYASRSNLGLVDLTEKIINSSKDGIKKFDVSKIKKDAEEDL